MEKKEKIILLVEDSEDIRNLFLLYLEEAGYTVVTACHGKEALDKARVQKPNIVVSDILMPIMDGFSLCRHWKKDPEFQKIPFIFYTATYTDSKDRELALNLGADHFILKPSNPALMVEKINYVLEMYEAGKLKVGRPKMEYPDLVEQYNSALVRKLEDKMAEVEQSYLFCKSILNQMQEALFVLDQEGRLEWANQRFMKVFLSQESTILLGQKLEFLVPNLVQIKPFQKVLQDFFRGKQGEEVSQNFEISLDLPKKGFFKVKTFSLKPPRRNDPLLAVIIEDVTEKKLLEKQFFQAQKMESLGRMAGAMVHDINNLLTAIIGNLEILRSILPEENEGQEEIEAIERTCQKASSLSRKLLLLSKKRDEEHPKPMDLNLTIRNLAPILQSISGKSVDFKLHLQPNLPWIYGIPEHIEQILLNLFQNAKEAMPQGGTIEIRTKKAQIPTFLTHLNKENKYREYVVLSVEDGGIGIPAEEMDKIFDPFFSTKKNNTGLGLSSTYRMVKNLDGFILVHSKPQEGTVFEIYLPAVEVEESETKKVSENIAKLKASGTLVFIQHDPIILQILEKFFTPLGYQVYTASKYQDALELLENLDQIDILGTDVLLDIKDGVELAQKARSRFPKIKVIYLTSYLTEEAQEEVNRGKALYIRKPFSNFTLAEKIKSLLQNFPNNIY